MGCRVSSGPLPDNKRVGLKVGTFTMDLGGA